MCIRDSRAVQFSGRIRRHLEIRQPGSEVLRLSSLVLEISAPGQGWKDEVLQSRADESQGAFECVRRIVPHGSQCKLWFTGGRSDDSLPHPAATALCATT